MGRRRRDRDRKQDRPPVDSRSRPRVPPDQGDALAFTRWTGIFGGAGIAVAALGFFLLSIGSVTLAPILLLVAFLVCFPLALVK